MGFRSVFITEDRDVEWPAWFVNKYKDQIWFPENKVGCISAKGESKTFSCPYTFSEDVQKVLLLDQDLEIVFFHECGGVTKYKITPTSILASEPDGWEEVDSVTHSYCYGCSDPRNIPKELLNFVNLMAITLEYNADYPQKPKAAEARDLIERWRVWKKDFVFTSKLEE